MDVVECASLIEVRRVLPPSGPDVLFRGQVRNYADASGQPSITMLCPPIRETVQLAVGTHGDQLAA